nr:hypothetical protein [Rhodococcus sp. HNM0569]
MLLAGQLIDRSGMAHVIGAFGRETMTEVAIEEWMAASPVYTSRMRSMLGVDGDGVEDMFKCLQFDIGAPPQFMDFRYSIDDKYHGSFHLDHCGALIDVEPMGEEYVQAMCHDIEDPTFDATAIATNRRARIRPVHRPPRTPADRHPHCEWTVTIEPDRDELPLPAAAERMQTTRAAKTVLSEVDPSDEGRSDYSGPLLADVRWDEWSHSALVRIAEETALQHHLLALGFVWSVRERSAELVSGVVVKQMTGIAGLTSERLRHALDLGGDAAALEQVLRLHPLLTPTQYTGVRVDRDGERVTVTVPLGGDAVQDGEWLAFLGVDELAPLRAAFVGVDPTWSDVSAREHDGELVVTVGRGAPADEPGEVAVARFSTGAGFQFENRGIPLSITPVH